MLLLDLLYNINITFYRHFLLNDLCNFNLQNRGRTPDKRSSPSTSLLNIYFSSISLLESPYRFTIANSITLPSERQSFQNRRHIGDVDGDIHRHSMVFSYLDVQTIQPVKHLATLKKRRFLQFRNHASYSVGVTGFELLGLVQKPF